MQYKSTDLNDLSMKMIKSQNDEGKLFVNKIIEKQPHIISPVFMNIDEDYIELIYITQPFHKTYKLIKTEKSLHKGFTSFDDPDNYVLELNKNQKNQVINLMNSFLNRFR